MAEPGLAVVLGLGEKSPGPVPVRETVDGRVRVIQQVLEPLRQQIGRVTSSHPSIGMHPSFSLPIYSPAAGLILRLCRPDECGQHWNEVPMTCPAPGRDRGTGQLRKHLCSRFVRLILLKLFFCRGRL